MCEARRGGVPAPNQTFSATRITMYHVSEERRIAGGLKPWLKARVLRVRVSVRFARGVNVDGVAIH